MRDKPRARAFAVSKTEYPFRAHWLERDGSAMHYVDEGEGTPVLMLHGNPTWSFLYRNVIKDLAGVCRCIAPDYPGFGYSDHPPAYGYTPQEHAEWIRALVDRLDLQSYVVVVQDWGGPIGLSVAVDGPERVAGLVICNTWVWPPEGLPPRIFSWLVGGLLAKYLHLHHNLFAARLLPTGIERSDKRTPSVLKAYVDPFPTPASRMGTYVFPRAIRQSDGWLASIESRLARLRGRPVELVWAMKDRAFGTEAHIERWHRYFPDAPVDRLPDAGHYLQEDRPERVSAAVKRVLRRISDRERS